MTSLYLYSFLHLLAHSFCGTYAEWTHCVHITDMRPSVMFDCVKNVHSIAAKAPLDGA